MSKDVTVTDEEYKDYLTFVRKWALKKIDKHSKKIKKYASIYNGKDVSIVCYTKDVNGEIHILKCDK